MKRSVTVVLLKEHASLGKPGDVATVAYGYAKNLLIPNGIATFATPEALAKAKQNQEKREHEELQKAEKQKNVASTLSGITLSFSVRANEKGKLYGGIDQKEILRALGEQGIDTSLLSVELPQKIDSAGTHAVSVGVGKDAPVSISVVVTPAAES